MVFGGCFMEELSYWHLMLRAKKPSCIVIQPEYSQKRKLCHYCLFAAVTV